MAEERDQQHEEIANPFSGTILRAMCVTTRFNNNIENKHGNNKVTGRQRKLSAKRKGEI